MLFRSPDGQETLTEIVQAEAGSLVLPMQIASEAGTNSRTYIETTEPEAGTAVYSVNVDLAGVYKIVALVYGPSGESDAFYVEVDDLGAFVWDINVQDNPGEFEVWKKDEMTDQETVSAEAPKGIPYTVALSPGLHTIVISGWEASARLDAFYLEKVAEIPDDPVDIEAPVVSIGAPAYGDQVKGTVAVDVQASDNIAVVKSELYVDNDLHMTSEIAPFEFSLDTTVLPDGTYELFVKAYDAAGNVTQSETVLVYVQKIGRAHV